MAGRKTEAMLTSLDELVKEAEKVRVQIQQVSDQLTNPGLEFGTSVRLDVRRRELEAYLSGLLYALGKGPPLADPSLLEG